MNTENKAVFFDRDGTLNVDIHYLHRPEDFIWIPGAKEAIRHVNDRGYLAILVTNQSGVARGYYPESDVQRVYDWMNSELQKVGAHLDALYYCPHHPQGKVPAYTKTCSCRKPATGLIDAACARFHKKRTRRMGPSRDIGFRVAISCTQARTVRRCLARLRTGSTKRWILPNKRREARRCDLHGVSTYSNLS